MYVVFNALNSGLGNNGGSRTLIKCAATIEKIGHKCDIIAQADNFTWFEHKPPINYLPKDADAIVATACTTVDSTLKTDVPIKAWYVRGHESWMYSEDVLSKLYNAPLINIANSYGLKRKIEEVGAEVEVVHQGIDLDLWKDLDTRGSKTRIGCLYQKKSTKRWEDFIKLSEILGTYDYEYVAFGDTIRKDSFLCSYMCSASSDELSRLYSSCHIWFVPTELEGLHNPPMEAALCGVLVVCNDHPMNGISLDYGFNSTAMVYKHRDIENAAELIRNADYSKVDIMKEFLTVDIGSREKNMLKLIDYLGG